MRTVLVNLGCVAVAAVALLAVYVVAMAPRRRDNARPEVAAHEARAQMAAIAEWKAKREVGPILAEFDRQAALAHLRAKAMRDHPSAS